MYNISTELKNAFLASKRKLHLKVVIAGKTLTDDSIISMSIISTIGESDAFTFGNYTKRQLDMEVLRADVPLVIKGQTITAYVGAEVNGNTSYLQLGVFSINAKDVLVGKTTISFTAYDNMRKCTTGGLSMNTAYTKKNLAFYTNLLCTTLGVTLNSSSSSYITSVDSSQKWTMDLEKAGNTIVRTMQSVCTALGATAVINNMNELEFVRIRSNSDITLTPDFYTDLTLYDVDVFQLEGLQLVIPAGENAEEDTIVNYPSSNLGSYISIEANESNLFSSNTSTARTQLGYIADNITENKGSALPFRYQGYTMTSPCLPFVECGDRMSVTDLEGVTHDLHVISHTLSFDDGAFTSEFKATIPDSEDNTINTSGGAISTAISNVVSNIVQVKEVFAEKVEADEGRFNSLEATVGTFDNLIASKATMGEIEANFAKIENLEAANAKIDNLEANKATIKELEAVDGKFNTLSSAYAKIDFSNITDAVITNAMIQNEAVGTSQIADGSITDAKIVELTANKITAGTLDVDRLILNQDGEKYLVHVNEHGVTTYEKLDGNVLEDRSITADKIVANAITANEIASKTITANEILANTITANELASDAIKSKNYNYSSGHFSTAGTMLNLNNGTITSPNFAITSTGDAYFKGDIEGSTISGSKYEYILNKPNYLFEIDGGQVNTQGGSRVGWWAHQPSDGSQNYYDRLLIDTGIIDAYTYNVGKYYATDYIRHLILSPSQGISLVCGSATDDSATNTDTLFSVDGETGLTYIKKLRIDDHNSEVGYCESRTVSKSLSAGAISNVTSAYIDTGTWIIDVVANFPQASSSGTGSIQVWFGTSNASTSGVITRQSMYHYSTNGGYVISTCGATSTTNGATIYLNAYSTLARTNCSFTYRLTRIA